MKIKVGDTYNPKTQTIYRTRDTVNAIKLLKLAQAMADWKKRNESSEVKSTQRHVKAIKEII